MEYRQFVRESNRYPGRPTVMSPQLQDFNILEHVRHPVPCEKEEFILVFDVSFVEEEELKITFPEDHVLKLSLKHGCRNAGDLYFGRDCVYIYKLPEDIQPGNLVGLWTEDNFLIIREKKPEILEETMKTSKTEDSVDEKPSEAQIIPTQDGDDEKKSKSEAQQAPQTKDSVDEKPSEAQVISTKDGDDKKKSKSEAQKVPQTKEGDSKKPKRYETRSISQDSVAKKKPKQTETQTVLQEDNLEEDPKSSEVQAVPEADDGRVEKLEDPISDTKSDTNNGIPRLIPQRTEKIYKPVLSVVELKRLMSDIEDRMLFAKRFIENHSFATPHEPGLNEQTEEDLKMQQPSEDITEMV